MIKMKNMNKKENEIDTFFKVLYVDKNTTKNTFYMYGK